MITRLRSFFNPKISIQLYFWIFIFFLCSFIPIAILRGNTTYFLSFCLIPILFLMFLYLKKYHMYFFLFSLFFGTWLIWFFRLQAVNLISYVIILFFITNQRTDIFNKFKLPKLIKFLSFYLILSVTLSSFLSPHKSLQNYYMIFLFLNYIIMGYVAFRSINNQIEIKELLHAFVYMIFVNSFFEIIEIVLTSKLRSTAFTRWASMDFIVFCLLFLVTYYFFLGKLNIKVVFVFLVLFTTLITNQSRFAWLGLLLSLIYSFIICYKFEKNSIKFIQNKFSLILFLIFVVIIFSIVSGLGNIIMKRVLEINFDFFQSGTQEGDIVSNSLESRILIWLVAYNTFIQNPIFGVGYFMFSQISEFYNMFPPYLYIYFVKDNDAHTTFFNFLVETGIVGFIGFLTLFITIFVTSYKAIKISKNYEELKTSIILNTFIFFIFVHSIYSGAFSFGQSAFFMYFIFGITLANYIILKRKYIDPLI
jgi:O-antigen ligase